MSTQQIERKSIASRSFSLPHEVLDDPSLSMSQKRAILCEWASDACAVESMPALRLLPGTVMPVTLSAVIDALSQLDKRAARQAEEQAPRGIVLPLRRDLGGRGGVALG